MAKELRQLREDKFRLSELEKLIPSIYEDNVLGKIPEDVCVNLLYGHLKGFAKDIKDSAKISRKQVMDIWVLPETALDLICILSFTILTITEK